MLSLVSMKTVEGTEGEALAPIEGTEGGADAQPGETDTDANFCCLRFTSYILDNSNT